MNIKFDANDHKIINENLDFVARIDAEGVTEILKRFRNN